MLAQSKVMNEPIRKFELGALSVVVYPTKEALGQGAAWAAGAIIRRVIQEKGRARLMFSAANSQLDMIANLMSDNEIDWDAVEMFHVDEYAGLPLSHAESFGGWVKRNVADVVHPRATYYIRGDAPDAAAECERYARLLSERPIDVSFLGIGENGHIGFNDPHAADFFDPEIVKVVTLDEKCRLQQVAEGHWPDFASVPTQGYAVTCPALVNASHIICCVPGPRKAEAVRKTLEGPVSESCPASRIRTHPDARLCLDADSAAMLRLE